jgi:hypothetical protein
MAATSTLAVIGVNRSPFESGNRVLAAGGFVQRIRVDIDL